MPTMTELKEITDKPVVMANRDGLITYVNNEFEKVFGWKPSEIVGKPITTIIPPNFHDAHHLGFSRFSSTEQSTILNHPLKLKAVKKNGEIFSAQHIINAEKISGEWIFGATIEPIKDIA